MVKAVIIIILSFSITHFTFGQNQNKISRLTISDILGKNYHNGDTLSLKIKNTDSTQRTITIEAISLVKEPYYYNSVYSAYFNNDSLFFKKLNSSKAASTKNKVYYALPSYEFSPYVLNGNEEQTINFIIKGKSKIKGTPIKFRITSILINFETEVQYSNSFYLFSTPE
jgi:hypothetical protein